MKSHFLSLVAASLACLGLATPAHADTVNYTFTGFGTTATFSLPSNPSPSLVATNYFQINNVPITISGMGGITTNLDFFTTAGGGGLGSGTNILGGPQLFSGSLTSPTLLTGSFPLSGSVNPDGDGAVPVSGTLVANALGPVPEPSSFALLLTGAAGTLAAVRRRIRSARLA